MKKTGFAVLILVTGFSFGAVQTSAQGPAGVGATQAASSSVNGSGSSRSMNPIKWIKKDKSSSGSATSTDENKRLTALLQQNGVLPKDGDVSDVLLYLQESQRLRGGSARKPQRRG